MSTIHAQTIVHWHTYNLAYQMANVGAEVGRSIKWKNKGSSELMWGALTRALELLDATIADPKNVSCLAELLRVREAVCDFVVGDNEYKSTDQSWDRYFYHFTVAARRL